MEKKEESPQNVGCIIAVIGAIIASIGVSLMTGCVNLYTRCPGTDEKITQVYQCSREAAALSIIVAFPQMMSDAPHDAYRWENIFTVPLGCLCLCDAAVEACIDTVCLPVDWPLSASRKGGK